MSNDIQFTRGSGNVFADLNLPEPDVALRKAELAVRLSQEIEARNLTQKQAGEILGISQGNVSDIVRGRVRGFSVDRLMGFLTRFKLDVDIAISEVKDPDRSVGRIAIHGLYDDCAPGQELPMAARGGKREGVRFD